MIDISSAKVKRVIVHYVGNSLRDEGFRLSEFECERTLMLDELLLKHLLSPVVRDGKEYLLTHESNMALNTISHYASTIFETEGKFKDSSDAIAKHLYGCSNHPNIGGGEFIEILYDGIKDGDESRKALGLFRVEGKSDYLDVKENRGVFRVFGKVGISIEKIQKGAVVLSEGGKIFVVDNLSQKTRYWVEGFLKATPSITPKKSAQVAGALLKSISRKIKSPSSALDFSSRVENLLSSSELLSMNDLKQISKNFINDDEISSIFNGVQAKYGIPLEDKLSIESSRLTKYARDVIIKTKVVEGVNLVVSNPDAKIKSIDVKPIKSGFRVALDIQLKRI